MTSDATGAHAICREVLADIRFGRLKVGDPFPSEHAIMVRFGVSRTMVRDAVAMLAGMGVLNRAQGRRALVQRVDSASISRLFPLIIGLNGTESLREVYDLRILVETETAALASRCGTAEEHREILELAETYAESQQRRDVQPEDIAESVFISTDLRFHAAIARASRNTMYVSLLEVLTSFIKFVQVETCRGDTERSHHAGREHLRIAQAIVKRDSDAARLEMACHLKVSREALEKKLSA